MELPTVTKSNHVEQQSTKTNDESLNSTDREFICPNLGGNIHNAKWIYAI
jgi:hypothetical protein